MKMRDWQIIIANPPFIFRPDRSLLIYSQQLLYLP